VNAKLLLENFDLFSQTVNGIEKLRAYIFQLAIEGKLVVQNPNEESADILLSKIKLEKEKLTKQGKLKAPKTGPEVAIPNQSLPRGWTLTTLNELGLVNPRNSLADGLEVSFIPMTLIPEGFSGEASFEIRKWGDVKSGFTHIASNDVVMAKITPCFQNRKSVVLINLKNEFGAGTTELHVFRAIPNTVIPEYVLLFLKSANFINLGIPKMTGSAGQKRVPNDYFSFTPIPLPPREEQKRIVAKVDQLMALCDELEKKLTAKSSHLEKLTESLLRV
jgi:type I restriction enzyme S subunit